MNLFLHIGWPKTGTSAIQSFLYNNTKNFEKCGFYYPQPHRLDEPIPGNGWRIFPDRNTDAEIETFLDEISKESFDNVLLSCEGLIRTENVSYLRELTYRYFSNVFIIVYVRERVSHTLGYINELIMLGNDMHYSDWKSVPDFSACTLTFLDVFGKENVNIRHYKSVSSGWIYQDFLASLGLEASTVKFNIKENEFENVSLPSFLVETRRKINSFDFSDNSNDLYDRSFFKKLNDSLQQEQFDLTELSKDIRTYFQNSNSALKERVGIDLGVEGESTLQSIKHWQNPNLLSLETELILQFIVYGNIKARGSTQYEMSKLENMSIAALQRDLRIIDRKLEKVIKDSRARHKKNISFSKLLLSEMKEIHEDNLNINALLTEMKKVQETSNKNGNLLFSEVAEVKKLVSKSFIQKLRRFFHGDR